MMWKGSVRRHRQQFIPLIRQSNSFESSTRRTRSRAEPNRDLKDRLDVTSDRKIGLGPLKNPSRTVVETAGASL